MLYPEPHFLLKKSQFIVQYFGYSFISSGISYTYFNFMTECKDL